MASTHLLGREGVHHRRVDAAGELAAELHVAEQLTAHTQPQPSLEFLGGPVERERSSGCAVGDAPILTQLAALGRNFQHVTRRQLADTLEEKGVAGVVGQQQELIEAGLVHLRHELCVAEESLRLGGEEQQRAAPVPVERLDAEAVAHEVDGLRVEVDEREGEHAVHPLDHAVDAVLPVEVEQHLGVGPATEAVAARFEVDEVVEGVVGLAVVDDEDAAVGRAHRLVASGGRVEDGQPVEADTALERSHAARRLVLVD